MPPAPPTFSMITCWLRTSERRRPRMRPSTSVPPPAANGTTMVSGRAGQVWETAGVLQATTQAIRSIAHSRACFCFRGGREMRAHCAAFWLARRHPPAKCWQAEVSLHRCDTQLCIDKFSKRTSGLCGGMWQTSHTVGDSDRAYPKARNSSGATVLSHRVFGWGGKSSHTAPNIDRRAAKPGRREGAKAEKAVPFPGAVRRSKSFLASLRSTHSAGIDHARDTGGEKSRGSLNSGARRMG